MLLTSGTRLGPYEILAPLGAGGMGEVYRAKDTRLGRDVAVKVLPTHLSAQPEIRARCKLMSAAIETASGFRAGMPQELFRLPMSSTGVGAPSWVATADGERFFVFMPPRSSTVAKLEVVTDFHRLVGGK